MDPTRPEQVQLDALHLFTADWAIEPPRPIVPNAKYIGGVLTGPAGPLPPDLEVCQDLGLGSVRVCRRDVLTVPAGLLLVTLDQYAKAAPTLQFVRRLSDACDFWLEGVLIAVAQEDAFRVFCAAAADESLYVIS